MSPLLTELKDAILSRLTRATDQMPGSESDASGGGVENIPALANYVAKSLGWPWTVVGVFDDSNGLTIVFRNAASGRTQPICLTPQRDSWNVRAEIEREIRKAMALRGAGVSANDG